jgi:hypothetical protein
MCLSLSIFAVWYLNPLSSRPRHVSVKHNSMCFGCKGAFSLVFPLYDHYCIIWVSKETHTFACFTDNDVSEYWHREWVCELCRNSSENNLQPVFTNCVYLTSWSTQPSIFHNANSQVAWTCSVKAVLLCCSCGTSKKPCDFNATVHDLFGLFRIHYSHVIYTEMYWWNQVGRCHFSELLFLKSSLIPIEHIHWWSQSSHE